MKDRSRWNRREFVRMAGSSLGAMSFGPSLLARVTRASRRVAPRFAYVGFGGEGARDEGIAVYDLRGAQWRQTGVVASAAPS
jgi:hypothetical protein